MATTSPWDIVPISTNFAPDAKSTITPAFTTTSVRGFIRAEMRPAKFCTRLCSSFAWEKRAISFSSLRKARSTRTPNKFSRTTPVTLSRFFCTCLYIGVVLSMIEKTITAKTGMITANIQAPFTSTANAIAAAPNTMMGERKSKRSVKFTAACT